MKSSSTARHVVVVGGGPAGMIAAGRAAACGARVTLVEKNRRLGRKLLITGGGRCNVTNEIADRHLLVSRYGERAKGLHSVFARFDPQAMRAFLHERGLETKVENEGRVFPVTDSAASVRAVLEAYLAEGRVVVRAGSPVARIVAGEEERSGTDAASVSGVELCSGERIAADAVILATGGISRPETGSTGDGFAWLEELGHRVRRPEPSLVPIAVRESWPARLQGLALEAVKLTALLDGKPQLAASGKLLFTHFGLSGPLVLNMSAGIAEVAQGGPVRLELDLFPSTDGGELDRELQSILTGSSRKKLRNAVTTLVPPRLAGTLLELARVDGELPCHSVSKEARRALVAAMKRMGLTFASLLGADRAVVSSGGLAPDEVDFRTMASRRYRNLCVAGDLVDVDRRSGGYSLQLCWATGWVAGESSARVEPELEHQQERDR